LRVDEKLYGAENLDLAIPLTNLGTVVSAEKDYARAEGYYRRVLAIREKFEGADNADLAWPLNNLGNLYRAEGNYPKAVETSLRAVGILDKTATPYQPVTLLALGSLARNYAASGDRANAIKTQAHVDRVVEQNLALNLPAGSERQKLAFLNTVSWRTDRTVSLNLQLAPDDKDAMALATLVLLQRKGRVLDALADTLAALRQRATADDRARVDRLDETTAKLAKFAVNGPQKTEAVEYQKQLKALEEERDKLEAEVSRSSAEFRAQSQTVTAEAVQGAIPANGALIEFTAYRSFNPKSDSESEQYGPTRYAAYVVRRQGTPVGRDLGTAKEIDDAVNSLRAALRDPKRTDVRDLARAMDEKVMRPVRALIGDATQLLVSPDGELNLIPFGALVDEQGHYLIERYSVTYLTSGRDLLRMQVPREGKGKPLVVANPSFGELEASTPRPNVTVAREMSQLYFAPLGGTAEEAHTIQTLFPDASLLTGAEATESALKGISPPRILHIATHGFFLADAGIADGNPAAPTRGAGASSGIGNPLLRSGLALAGANRRGTGEKDNGILTALEASGLNLWGTKLAVLSACDTGVGEVRNGEGVYGLRRAFVLAGAESLVMSLWPASDYSTRHLMADYYKNLKQGLGRGESLRQVQLHLLKTNPQLQPFYWANFIQSGEWANLDGQR
jgi:CHAT domain-containing protein